MDHTTYMKRAIALAGCGLGTTGANPLVGAILVHRGQIIGEGWHQRAGEDHAEVRCFNSVPEADRVLIPESTMYVTLEPCDHQGRTPPCSLRIIQERVKKVVVAAVDPNPAAGGKGIERLRAGGIDVEVGICEAEARWINRRFLTAMECGRPYVVLKWAQTADGCMDPGAGADRRGPVWITGRRARQWVHKWRSEEQAILVGRKTAEIDDPQLNVREWGGEDPIRLVIDPESSLPGNLTMWELPGDTWTFGYRQHHPYSDRHFGIRRDEHLVEAVLEHLHAGEIRSVLVEGGYRTLTGFIECGLWDEARIFTGATTFGQGIRAPEVQGTLLEQRMIGRDLLTVLLNSK